jgi:hypothetical protein
MAIHVALPFNLVFHADGVSTTLVTNTTTSPYLWGNSTSYNLAASIAALIPTGTSGVTSGDGTVVSAVVGLLGQVTFTWNSPPAAGDYILGGYMIF